MYSLSELTLPQRIIFTFLIVLIILFALAAFGYFGGRWEEADAAPQPDLYQGIPMNEKLLELDKQALDRAYEQQILKLWGVWLTEGAKDSAHFKNGLHNARRAYGMASQAIAKREQESGAK